MARFPRSTTALVAAAFLAVACNSFSGSVHYSQGNDALHAGDSHAAIAHFERAAELVPEASEIQNHLGIAYQAAGRRHDALAAYERAVALDCDNAAAQHNLDALRVFLSVDPHDSTQTADGSPGPSER